MSATPHKALYLSKVPWRDSDRCRTLFDGSTIEIVIDKRAINSRRLKDFVEYYQNEKVPKASLARMILAWRFAGVGVLMYLADEAGYHREMAEIDGKPALIFSPPTTTPTA